MRSVADRARRLTRGTVGFLALLAGAALLAKLLFFDGDDATETQAAAADRGYYINDAKLTELGPDGKPRVVVKAITIEQQLSDQSVRLTQLDMDYTTPKQGVWHVTADRGRMPPDRQSLQLQGDVRVTGHVEPAGEAVIRTDVLDYDTKTNVVSTAAPVTIEFGPNRLLGRGLRAGLNEGTLQLESNVNGRFTPTK